MGPHHGDSARHGDLPARRLIPAGARNSIPICRRSPSIHCIRNSLHTRATPMTTTARIPGMIPRLLSASRMYTKPPRGWIAIGVAFFFAMLIPAVLLLPEGCSDRAKPASPRAPAIIASSDGHPGTRLQIAGGTIDLVITGSSTLLTNDDLIDWTKNAANAVSTYFGKFPVFYVRIDVRVGGEGHVNDGVTDDDGIRVRVGNQTKPRDLKNDWVLVHEMFHLAFPDMEEQYIWLREGLASYLEPLARARVGTLSEEDVWRDLVEGLPQGQPEAGDQGLDVTHTWGRTYWGGSMFCLLLDLHIREQTKNRKSIDDAMRTILNQGGNRFSHWTMDQVIEASDKATGSTAMRDLYGQMSRTPVNVDLTALWKKLGVHERNGHAAFDDSAPDGTIRRSMTK
jgi:hypothetical protein